MKKVWIVTYDWGSYGSGVGVFSMEEKAKACLVRKVAEKAFGAFDISDYTVDSETVG